MFLKISIIFLWIFGSSISAWCHNILIVIGLICFNNNSLGSWYRSMLKWKHLIIEILLWGILLFRYQQLKKEYYKLYHREEGINYYLWKIDKSRGECLQSVKDLKMRRKAKKSRKKLVRKLNYIRILGAKSIETRKFSIISLSFAGSQILSMHYKICNYVSDLINISNKWCALDSDSLETLPNFSFNHHEPGKCVCDLCTCGRHLYKIHKELL